MAGEYSQFNTGDFNFSDIWSAGNDQGLNQGQYQSLADSLGWGGNILDSGTFNGSDPMSSMGYQAYLQNPTAPDPSNMRISGDWLDSGFKDSLSGVRVQNAWDEEGNQNWNVFGPGNKQLNSFNMYKPDSSFDKLVGQVAPMAFTGMFGGGLANLFGSGFTGGALGQGLASGTMSAGQGGDFGKGFLSGAIGGGLQGLSAGTPAVMGNNPSAYVPATSGTSIAGLSGITNPTLAGMVNRGSGSFLGALAGGQSGSEALKTGLTGAGLSGVNSLGSNAMNYMDSLKSWIGGDQGAGDAGLDSLQGSGGDMSNQTDVSPNRYEEMLSGSDGMQTYNPDYGFGGDQLANTFSSATPDQRAQSAGTDFSLQSFLGDAGGKLGNFALNNAGDLASMLYGFYNNRKQQKALGQQASSLSSLYGQNSPYAQQLRAKLGAQAAQTGRRSNVAGRETQLQAMLADRNAQMAPTLMQLNQARGGLKNNNMNMLLQGMNKLGGFNAIGGGLKNLFGGSNTYQDGGFNLSGMQNPYGSDVAFNNWGG